MSMPFGFLLSALIATTRQTALLPKQDETRFFQDLVREMSGPSERGGDMVVDTLADKACTQLEAIGTPVIPFVVTVLNSPVGWARVHAIEVLANLHAKQAVAKVLDILRHDPEAGIRAIAAENLGRFGDPTVVPALLKAARSSDHDIAHGAWKSLGDLRDPKAIPVLIAHLSATERAVPSLTEVSDPAPGMALTAIGAAAVDPLIECFRRSKEPAKTQAAIALGQIGTTKAMAFLKNGLSKAEDRNASAKGLLKSSSLEAVPVAIAYLTSGESGWLALRVLEKHPTPKCLSAVRAGLPMATKQHYWEYMRFATKILGQADPKAAEKTLIEIAKGDGATDDDMGALRRVLGTRAIPILVDIATDWIRLSDSGTPASAASCCLAGFGRPAVDGLMAKLKQKGPAVAIGHALSMFTDPRLSTEMACIATTTFKPEVRAGALIALGRMKDRTRADMFREALNDPSPKVREAGARALALIGDSTAIPLLLDLRKNKGADVVDEWVALGETAAPALGELLEDNDWSVRTAIVALRSPVGTSLLIRGLKLKSVETACFCIKELVKRRDKSAIPAFVEAFRRPELDVRFEAYMALRKLKN